jgi:hypothetical protein
MHSNEPVNMSDVIVCIDPHNSSPSIERNYKLYKSPAKVTYCPGPSGRAFPQFESDGKPASSVMYISIQSQIGCNVVVYVGFPRDKKSISMKQMLSNRRKRASENA